MRRRSATSNRPMRRGDHDGRQRAVGKVLEHVGRHHDEQGDRQRADDAGQLCLRACGLGYRGARRAAADGEALKEAGREVGGAESHHLLIRVDAGSGSRRVSAREHARVGERNEGDRAAADHDRDEVGVGDPGDGERRQTLRGWAQNRHIGARRQVERSDDGGRAHDGDQDSRNTLAALEQKDHRQGSGADRERRPVRLSRQHGLRECPDPPQRTFALAGETEELGQLADDHRQRNAVHVPVADRLGQKLGDETEPRDPRQDAYRPRNDRHHAGDGDGATRVAAGERHHDGENDGNQRRIRPQHQDSTRSE